MNRNGNRWVSSCTWIRHDYNGVFTYNERYPTAEMYRFGVPEVMGRTVRPLQFVDGRVKVMALCEDHYMFVDCPDDVQVAYQEYCKRLVDAAIEKHPNDNSTEEKRT